MTEPALFGRDLFGHAIKPKPSGPVAERFCVPPFSILDTRQGDWIERRRAWVAMGLKGDDGRDGSLTFNDPSGYQAKYSGKADTEPKQTSTSIFDPLLCELAYRWFCPAGGQVVDPFAGGSVRGIVAGALGRSYWGCDLRPEQIAANEAQAGAIEPTVRPVWVCGDSIDTLDGAPDADFVFSCPPYGDLEVYSDNPRDLSNMEHHTFIAAYKRIILRAVRKMKPDTFACFVVGDFRDSRGFYRNFVSDTISAFEEAGARYYNEAILVNSVGTAAMRVTKQFEASRKLAKTHQNVLVFCKGDPKTATAKITGK